MTLGAGSVSQLGPQILAALEPIISKLSLLQKRRSIFAGGSLCVRTDCVRRSPFVVKRFTSWSWFVYHSADNQLSSLRSMK